MNSDSFYAFMNARMLGFDYILVSSTQEISPTRSLIGSRGSRDSETWGRKTRFAKLTRRRVNGALPHSIKKLVSLIVYSKLLFSLRSIPQTHALYPLH